MSSPQKQEGFFKNMVAGTALAASLAAGTPTAKPASTNTATIIKKWEGLRDKVYKDSSGNATIGVGHFLNGTEQDRKLFTALFVGTVNYDRLLRGEIALTKPRIDKLLQADIKIKEAHAKKLIPAFPKFNAEAQQAVLNAMFRGDIGKKTIALLNAGKYREAAKEYLNHPNFRSGPQQIKDRMKTNAIAIANINIKSAGSIK